MQSPNGPRAPKAASRKRFLGRGGRPTSVAVATGLLALVMLAAACGGTGSASTTGTTADQEQALLSFAKCMRQHGVNIPDPTVDANGNVRIQPPQGANGATPSRLSGTQRSKFEAARQECGKYLRDAFQGFTQADRTKLQDALVKYAQCMRQHGVNVPDPNFNATPSPDGNGRTTGGPFGNINRNDPAVQKADQACRSILTDAGLPGRGGLRFGGGGGGNGGGGNGSGGGN